MLEIKGMRLVRGGKTIVDVPDIHLSSGQFTCIVGRNGAGKSSFLKTMSCLTEAEIASYKLDGQPRELPRDRLTVTRNYAHVFQSPLLFSGSVLYNVSLPLRLRGAARKDADKEAMHWLEVVQAEGLAHRSPHTLSGGEGARVSLARALVNKPKVVFLDEPFSALDVESRAYVLRHLRQWLDLSGSTGVMVTHDYAEVASLADRVIVMDEGQVVADGKPAHVLENPEMPFLRDFVSLGQIKPRWK